MNLYTIDEIKNKIKSNEYGAELMLQHAMLNIELLQSKLDITVDALEQIKQSDGALTFTGETANEALNKIRTKP